MQWQSTLLSILSKSMDFQPAAPGVTKTHVNLWGYRKAFWQGQLGMVTPLQIPKSVTTLTRTGRQAGDHAVNLGLIDISSMTPMHWLTIEQVLILSHTVSVRSLLFFLTCTWWINMNHQSASATTLWAFSYVCFRNEIPIRKYVNLVFYWWT